MKKIIIIVVAFLGLTSAANAQNASGAAQQTVQLALSNALEITFTGGPATISLPFNNVNDYATGVESAAQQIKVRSNKPFNVTVKSSMASFSVTNAGLTTVSSMPVTGVLDVKVASNQTGGSIVSAFDNAYGNISTTAANMITNGTYGNNQTFSVQYKATPGFAYPSGTYTTSVVYTATQQ